MDLQYLTTQLKTCKIKYSQNTVDIFLKEHQLLIHTYNQNFLSEYLNINHTKKYLNSLPNYKSVLSKSKKYQLQIFNELNNSNYFGDVWKIKNEQYLLVNFLILIYRTSLLNLNSTLRQNSVQISSTIEELAAQGVLKSGELSLIYKCTKHWIKDYKNEGFSKRLYSDLVNNKLL